MLGSTKPCCLPREAALQIISQAMFLSPLVATAVTAHSASHVERPSVPVCIHCPEMSSKP